MPNEKIKCRIAVQICIGHFPDGRERHRTFSLRDINPDVSADAIREIIRALAPLLAYPITKVRKVIKRELFSVREERHAEDAVPVAAVITPPAGAEPAAESGRIIPFPVSAAERQAAQMAIGYERQDCRFYLPL